MVSIFFIICAVINVSGLLYVAYSVYDLRKRKKLIDTLLDYTSRHYDLIKSSIALADIVNEDQKDNPTFWQSKRVHCCLIAYNDHKQKAENSDEKLQEALGMKTEEFEPVSCWEIIKHGELGAMYAPMQISRWVVMRKLTLRERLRALFGKTVAVTESYPSEPVDAPKTYELRV